MKKYKLILVGCDDETEVELELEDDEIALIERISNLANKKATRQCQPSIRLKDN